MDQVRVLRVVIASPGDVKAEREIIPRVVEEVNRNIARPRGLHLDVYRWETDSYPGFHPEGPQGLIDPILKIEDCDILICIFWRRFGTPVSDARSGTEHEFLLAHKAWKKNRKPEIMVYFSQKPYSPQSKEETDEWGLVLQFKKKFPGEGLWWEYKNKSEFERLTRNHLTAFLSARFPIGQLAPESVALTALFQLPSPPADFIGREVELRDLRAVIENGGTNLVGLQGQGGVGKTALVLKLAAELAPDFPDAQIYLDLRGVGGKPITSAEALSHVIRAFHPEAKLSEKEEEELRAYFNSILQGKRTLLLMDNAKDALQIKPLIPPEGSILLVTSRFRFTLPGLHQKNLDTFPLEDATRLLLEIAPRIQPEAESIAELCGFLPLALRVAGNTIAERPELLPKEYLRHLRDEKQRMKMLASNSSRESVEASVNLSYSLLDSETQKLWRTLSVFPETFSSTAAAAFWQIDPDRAHDVLGRFLGFSLLEWHSDRGRYGLHDLVRIFANGRLTPMERQEYETRHLAYYAVLLHKAARADDDSISSEWENIRAGQSRAAAHVTEHRVYAECCFEFAMQGDPIGNLAGFLTMPLYRAWLKDALKASRYLQNHISSILVLEALAKATGASGTVERLMEGREYLDEALSIAKTINDKAAENAVLKDLEMFEKFIVKAREEQQ